MSGSALNRFVRPITYESYDRVPIREEGDVQSQEFAPPIDVTMTTTYLGGICRKTSYNITCHIVTTNLCVVSSRHVF